MKAFFLSDAGKAMVGLFLTAILIVFPAASGWLAASVTLSFTIAKLRNAFRRLEAEEAAESIRGADASQIDATSNATRGLAVGRHRRRPIDHRCWPDGPY